MWNHEIDHETVYRALPGPVLLLTPELIIVDANDAYVKVTGRSLNELRGRYVFDVFPDNPIDPGASGKKRLLSSWKRVRENKTRDAMALQRYDIEMPDEPGKFHEKYWSIVNAPVLGPRGDVVLIINRVEDVTNLVFELAGSDGDDRRRAMEAELYARAQDLQDLNEQLRRARDRERHVALTLQEAMLPAPLPLLQGEAAVRYRPAARTTANVCGDWYELVNLPDGRVGVAVGDVVGHGLSAAGVMGQLRSALSAAVRVVPGPANALDVLGLYARSVAGAESATAVQAVIDAKKQVIDYSCAGHPPPALLHVDGTVEFLDKATDPPLGARPVPRPRSQGSVSFELGATLVLYTDGLVERRTEDIYTGLARLADSLSRHSHLKPEALADRLLDELSVTDDPMDDTALVIIRL
ncbi:MAG: SpoIIE family protein phosphatase [Corynebacteriales bacterium]|nr:SpoIIE family protein phosphatase [Mycobacteriales bacterium]